jgi:MFS family permease
VTPTAPTPADTLPGPAARRVLLTSLVFVWMGFTVLFPLLAPIGREMGLNEFQITSIIGCSSLTVFLITPIWGRTSDRWGRKRVMLIGLLGFTGGTVLFNLVLTAGLAGWLVGLPLFLTLITARVMHAAVMSAAMPASTAYMADITDVANRTRGMGATGAAGNLGSILGPALAGLAVVSLLTPLWLVAGLVFLNALVVWRFLPEPRRHLSPGTPVARMRFTDPRILPFVVVGVLMFMGHALVQQTMGFRFQDALDLSTSATAGVFGVAMMLAAATSLVAQAVVVQRMSFAPFTLLRLAIPLLILAFVMMALTETRWLLTAAMMIQGFGMGLAAPGFMAGASMAVSADEQGAVAGIAGACPPLGFALGPFIGGALYQVDPVVPYAFAAVVYVVLLGFMQWLGRSVAEHAEAA